MKPPRRQRKHRTSGCTKCLALVLVTCIALTVVSFYLQGASGINKVESQDPRDSFVATAIRLKDDLWVNVPNQPNVSTTEAPADTGEDPIPDDVVETISARPSIASGAKQAPQTAQIEKTVIQSLHLPSNTIENEFKPYPQPAQGSSNLSSVRSNIDRSAVVLPPIVIPPAKEPVGPESSSGPRGPFAAPIDDGRGPFGGVWRPVADLDRDDWVVYLRVQKTGSQTFWQTLQQTFDGSVWGRSATCQKGLFCGHRCQGVVEEQISEIVRSRAVRKRAGSRVGQRGGAKRFDPNQCSLVFRGHINWRDYAAGFAAQFTAPGGVAAGAGSLAPPPRVFFLTFLREPVARAVSEFRHVTEGLVAQFGPHTFGAAWEYNFTFDPAMPIEEKRRCGVAPPRALSDRASSHRRAPTWPLKLRAPLRAHPTGSPFHPDLPRLCLPLPLAGAGEGPSRRGSRAGPAERERPTA